MTAIHPDIQALAQKDSSICYAISAHEQSDLNGYPISYVALLERLVVQLAGEKAMYLGEAATLAGRIAGVDSRFNKEEVR